jgi:hypothetical protein
MIEHGLLKRSENDRNESDGQPLSPGSVAGSFVMRRSNWTPSIVPNSDDQDVYLVANDLGRLGRIWPDADLERTDLESVVQDLLEGQYSDPIRVVSFNTAEGWSRDVSADVAQELRRRCDLQRREVPSSILDFVEHHEGQYPRQLTLQLG